MKFIKFFYLLSLTAIIASILAQDAIVQTSFFKNYLDESVEETSRSLIHTSEIPEEVIKGFMESPFKDLSIREVYKVEGQVMEMPIWVQNVINKPESETKTSYVLAVADNINQNVKTVLSFSHHGKLLNIEN